VRTLHLPRVLPIFLPTTNTSRLIDPAHPPLLRATDLEEGCVIYGAAGVGVREPFGIRAQMIRVCSAPSKSPRRLSLNPWTKPAG
jgi:hypothetical protein